MTLEQKYKDLQSYYEIATRSLDLSLKVLFDCREQIAELKKENKALHEQLNHQNKNLITWQK